MNKKFFPNKQQWKKYQSISNEFNKILKLEFLIYSLKNGKKTSNLFLLCFNHIFYNFDSILIIYIYLINL